MCLVSLWPYICLNVRKRPTHRNMLSSNLPATPGRPLEEWLCTYLVSQTLGRKSSLQWSGSWIVLWLWDHLHKCLSFGSWINSSWVTSDPSYSKASFLFHSSLPVLELMSVCGQRTWKNQKVLVLGHRRQWWPLKVLFLLFVVIFLRRRKDKERRNAGFLDRQSIYVKQNVWLV